MYRCLFCCVTVRPYCGLYNIENGCTKIQTCKKSLLTVALENTWKRSKPETTDVAYTKMRQDGHAKQNNYKADDLESF